MRRLTENEREGRADTNPYARPLYRRYLMTLTEYIAGEVESTGKPGRRKAHVALLKALDPASVAFIAMNTAITGLMAEHLNEDGRTLGRAIAVALYRELVLGIFENIDHETYWKIVHDIERRRSTDQRYKYRVVRDAATKKEIQLPDWTQSDREQVGLFIVEAMRIVGFLDVDRVHINKPGRIKEVFKVSLSDAALAVVCSITQMVELTTPIHLPFIEQPKDWTRFNRGGYHTDEMRRLLPYCISAPRASRDATLDIYRSADLTKVRAAINKLQAVRWQVNTEMLDAVRAVAARMETDEILMQADIQPPPRPSWLPESRYELKPEDMTPEQQEGFKEWKRQMRDWHNAKRIRKSKFQRFYSATSVADRFKAHDTIYFLYQADFRGRLYAVTTGISPQGSDLQKALLRFSDGKPITGPDAERWFLISGANRFGVDKVTFKERIQWVRDNSHLIVEAADDPAGCKFWSEADSPLQFLAWCKEYAAWKRNPSTFLSHLPIGMDGSCNGLQHFSAMLRDEVGGKATNLVPGEIPNDIYQQVADVVTRKLKAMDLSEQAEREQIVAQKWLEHGISRKLVKRSVMTLPYGSTRFSCAQFIVDDYLRPGLAPEFDRSEFNTAANFLSYIVWDAIGEVVVAATSAMEWLKQCAGKLISKGEQCIRWTAPTGFPVVQVYHVPEMIQVRSMLLGGVKINIATNTDDPHRNRHKNGISPNFVHSMDASHLVFTVLEANAQGIDSLAMIHDDYGTHAADAEKLYQAIRSTFVRMYETHDPLTWFRDHYDGLPEVPRRGKLDIQEVARSQFFFA